MGCSVSREQVEICILIVAKLFNSGIPVSRVEHFGCRVGQYTTVLATHPHAVARGWLSKGGEVGL